MISAVGVDAGSPGDPSARQRAYTHRGGEARIGDPNREHGGMRYLVAWMAALAATVALDRAPAAGEGQGAHAFAFTSIGGEPLPMQGFAGRPVLVVNTASLCGFTYQYAALQRVWEAYRGRGLVVLGVPSNDFGGQEPGSGEEIKTFCEANFDVDFPLTEKVHVTGAGSHPLFAWLREELGAGAGPRWNFHKYLIAPDGGVVGAWPSAVKPDGAPITAAVEKLLPPPS
jgi:glutathione peroxidase